MHKFAVPDWPMFPKYTRRNARTEYVGFVALDSDKGILTAISALRFIKSANSVRESKFVDDLAALFDLILRCFTADEFSLVCLYSGELILISGNFWTFCSEFGIRFLLLFFFNFYFYWRNFRRGN